jgi:predicted dehydrogenase
MSVTTKARLAVVGLGKMGIMHTSMVRTCPRSELVALCDRDEKLVAHVNSMAGEGVAGFGDVAAMIDAVQPDGVVIATPQFTHRAVAEQCLRRGVAVLTEKPLAHTLDDATAMLELARAHPDVPFGVAFMKGHDDFYLLGAAMAAGAEWRSFVGDTREAGIGLPTAPAEGVLGRVASFRVSVSLGQVFAPTKGWTFTWDKAGGGVLINTGVHTLLLMRLFFGRLVRVSCLASPLHSETEDTLSALVLHERADGTRIHGTVHVSYSTPDCATEATEIVAEGTDGWLWFEDNALRIHRHKQPIALKHSGALPLCDRLTQGWTTFERADYPARAAFNMSPEYGGEGYANEIDDFASAILDRRQPLFTPAHGWEMQSVVDAYYRSMRADGAPTQPVPPPVG